MPLPVKYWNTDELLLALFKCADGRQRMQVRVESTLTSGKFHAVLERVEYVKGVCGGEDYILLHLSP